MTNMQGKTVLITGGTGGIGKATAIGLAQLGATVVVTGRDPIRGAAAVAEIQAAGGHAGVHLLTADLASQGDLRRLAATVKAHYTRLDVLINNVGLLPARRDVTVDGIETSFAVNHLAPFLLTHLLLDLLVASAPARIINVTGGMPIMRPDPTNLQSEKQFQPMESYSHAKAVMMATAYEFAQRLEGSGVTLNVAYPGAAATAMTQGLTPAMMPWFMRPLGPIFLPYMRNAKPERAARSSIFLAASPDVASLNGMYFNTNSKPAAWPKAVKDAALRQQLWAISADLSGIAPDAASHSTAALTPVEA